MPGLDDTLSNIENLMDKQNKRKQEKTRSVIGRYTKGTFENEENKINPTDEVKQTNDNSDIPNDELADNINKSASNEKEGFTTSFIFKYEFEDILMQIKRRLSRKYKIRISKTDAIEMGFLLLQNLEDEVLHKITQQKDFENNVVEALKQVLEKN
ncbi:MAG: hypothetical protein ACOCRK_04965 [bacterium]